jgi:hypothetical protein
MLRVLVLVLVVLGLRGFDIMVLGSVVAAVFIALLVFGSVGCFVVLVVVRCILPSELPVGVGGAFDSIGLLCAVSGCVMLGLAIMLYLVFRHR